MTQLVAGFLGRDAHNSYLALELGDDDTMMQLRGQSITYRIAVGSQQGRRVFSPHAGVLAEAHQRGKSERLCRPSGQQISCAYRSGKTVQATSNCRAGLAGQYMRPVSVTRMPKLKWVFNINT